MSQLRLPMMFPQFTLLKKIGLIECMPQPWVQPAPLYEVPELLQDV